jgi:uroporphyrinogen decarboxylase
MVSPNFLRQKIFPWHRICAEIAHNSNRPYLIHSCGKLDEIMPDLINNVKIDAKHSFEDTILPVTEAFARYSDKIAILGGIDMDFLCRKDEESIRKRVRKTLEICMQKKGYCLGTGNTVANYIPLDNYLTMLDEGFKFTL